MNAERGNGIMTARFVGFEIAQRLIINPKRVFLVDK